MTDCKGIVTGQDILDKQPDDPLALRNIHGLGALLQPGEKACQGFGEFQPGFLFPRLTDDGLPFGADSLFLLSQMHCPIVESRSILTHFRGESRSKLTHP